MSASRQRFLTSSGMWFSDSDSVIDDRDLPTKLFNLQLRFTKSRVDKDEVIEALQAIIKELKSS